MHVIDEQSPCFYCRIGDPCACATQPLRVKVKWFRLLRVGLKERAAIRLAKLRKQRPRALLLSLWHQSFSYSPSSSPAAQVFEPVSDLLPQPPRPMERPGASETIAETSTLSKLLVGALSLTERKASLSPFTPALGQRRSACARAPPGG